MTKQAYAMVSVYGLNKRIGNRSFYDPRAEATFTKPYSEETARIIDEEAGAIIERAYAKAREILELHKDKLNALSERLLEREVLFKEDLIELLGPRPWEQETKVSIGENTVGKPQETTEAEAAAPEAAIEAPEPAQQMPSDESSDEESKQEGGADENAA